MPPTRILLANHQPIIRSALRLLLEREPEFRVVAEAADGREAVALAEFKHPDIVLVEVKLPYVNGIAVTRQIASKIDGPKAVFVTAETDESYVQEAFKAGARGYVAGDSAPSDMARAVQVVAGGGVFLSPAICRHFLESQSAKWHLSEYEKQLFCCMAAGYAEREMAKQFNRDVNQIRTDCQSINNFVPRIRLPETIAKALISNHSNAEKVHDVHLL